LGEPTLVWRGVRERLGAQAAWRLGAQSITVSLQQTHSRPAEELEHYSLRDTTQTRVWSLGYHTPTQLGKVNLKVNFTELKSNVTALRHFEGDTKRWAYFPVGAGFGSLDAEVLGERWDFGLWGALGRARLRKSPGRFFETLAPNRMLDGSLLATLSFAAYNTTFFLDGPLDFWAGAVRAARTWRFRPGAWELAPQAKVVIAALGGHYDMLYAKETGHLIAFTYREEERTGGGFALLALAELNFRVKSPWGVSLLASATQAFPFYTHFELPFDASEFDGWDSWNPSCSWGGCPSGGGGGGSGNGSGGSSGGGSSPDSAPIPSAETSRKDKKEIPFLNGFWFSARLVFDL
jgi:uncharacterized membrane protein YgcG